MTDTNGHGPRTCVIYVRVSTDEQARHGFSLAGQETEVRSRLASEGREVLEEVRDPGYSSQNLNRPGVDRVRELVVAGGVDEVWTWRWDRFGESPWPEMLALEFEPFGCKLRSLDDGGEGEDADLLNGLKGLLKRRENRTIVTRSRMAKLQKAREGKLIKSHTAHYGFAYDERGEGYEVVEENMAVVRRVFEMVGTQRLTLYAVCKRLNDEGTPTPSGRGRWRQKTIRDIVLDDVYKPHAHGEIAALVSPEVTSRLDPERDYGLVYYGRRKIKTEQVAEPDGSGGRRYRRAQQEEWVAKEDCIPIPVPSCGVPRTLVDAARDTLKDNRKTFSKGDRLYELSGGVFVCGGCGCRMSANPNQHHAYYRCAKKKREGGASCPQDHSYRADEVEGLVWEFILGLLMEPRNVAAALDRLIAVERDKLRSDPEGEERVLLRRLGEVRRQRENTQNAALDDLLASGVIDRGVLEHRITELDAQREILEREIEACRGRGEGLRELEALRDDWASGKLMWFTYADGLDHRSATAEQKRETYRRHRLSVNIEEDGEIVLEGTFGRAILRGTETPCAPVS